MEQVAGSEPAMPAAPGGTLLPVSTRPSLTWIEPYFRRHDLAKTDMKAPFQLKYRPIQRNCNSLSLSLSLPKTLKKKRVE